MRKIKKKFENPIDNILIDIADYLCPYFKILNFTPNHITGLSLIFGVISIYNFYNKKFKYASIYFFISYFFDIMDGHYARKYKQVTKNGDLFDHIKDIIVYISLVVLFFKFNKYKNIHLIIICIIWISILYCTLTHLGHQEKIYNTNESESLSFLKDIVKNKNSSTEICKTKFCGNGSLILYTCLIIYFIPNK